MDDATLEDAFRRICTSEAPLRERITSIDAGAAAPKSGEPMPSQHGLELQKYNGNDGMQFEYQDQDRDFPDQDSAEQGTNVIVLRSTR